MGKAILATRVGDVPAYFTHLENAYLCEPDSQEELAERLRNLLRTRPCGIDWERLPNYVLMNLSTTNNRQSNCISNATGNG